MPNPIIVVRAHYFDPELEEFVRRLETTGWPVVMVVDEGRRQVDVPAGMAKVSLNAQSLSEAGLFFQADQKSGVGDIGWRCGDYSLYLARRAYPGHSHYILIEPDVEIHARDLAGLARRLIGLDEVDFMAHGIRQATASWYWHHMMADVQKPVWRCLFSLVCASGRAVDAAYETRQTLGATARETNWPNDESFFATAICNDNRFAHADLTSLGLSSGNSFSFHRPFSRTLLRRRRFDGLAYHPVLSGNKFLAKADALLAVASERRRLSAYTMFTPQFLEALQAECGPQAVVDFKTRMDFQLRDIGHSPVHLRCYQMLRSVYNRIRRSPD